MLEVRLSTSLFAVLLACFAGCGDESSLVPVEGVITLDGRPLPSIQVLFDQPELGANENTGYTGKSDEQGRYVLRPVIGEGSGAPPGKYRVSLSTAADPTSAANTQAGAKQSTIFYPEAPPPPPERVPPAYRGGKLSMEIPADGKTDANFELKSR
jgi:hypothetical protein